MNDAFGTILRMAGEWTRCLSLRTAEFSQAEQTLHIALYSTKPVTQEQEGALKALLMERFPGIRILLRVDMPVFAEIVNGVQAPKTPKAQKAAKEKPAAAVAERPKGLRLVTGDGETLLYGKKIARGTISKMDGLTEEAGRVVIEGKLLSCEEKELKKKTDYLLVFANISDTSNTMRLKFYCKKDEGKKLLHGLKQVEKDGRHLRARGDCVYDSFERGMVFKAQDLVAVKPTVREDTSPEKRVELHFHTNMSALDALVDVGAAVKRAAAFGHKALAITDHGVVQAFPEAYKAGAKHGVKILYGMEGYLQQDATPIPMEQTYVVFDIETTGLQASVGQIIEIGAVKIENGRLTERFSTFVNGGTPIPPKITELTGIDDDMLKGAPTPREALLGFRAFCGEGCVFVAHNASFDIGYIREHGARYDISFTEPYVDTLMLSRYLLLNIKNHKLNTVCAHLGVSLLNHHRAVDDAEATAGIYLQFLGRIRALDIHTAPAVLCEEENRQKEKGKAAKYHHIVLLAATEEGMKNLYRLVSHAHLYFYQKKPQIPKFLLTLFRAGLLVGSACEQGEVFHAVLHGGTDGEVAEKVGFYDYLEIQPIGNNAFLRKNGAVETDEQLREFNRRIFALGKQHQKPVVATGDVHFLEPEDWLFRAILMHQQGYPDAIDQAPLYFKTTEEMLEEFAYLGEAEAREAVIDAPNAIADRCGELKPYPDGTYPPEIEGAEAELERMARGKAHELYGEVLPEVVDKRLLKELNSIIDHGFASLYLVAEKLVKKSLNDGYLVGSRGSVGSSFVATMAGITEVNPLQPHYLCRHCTYSDFQVDREKYACGVDMPPKKCPVCGQELSREGFDIPFETFLGFQGDKTPDIDLNFSGEYQPIAHKYTEEMFGEGHAFRAGTIGSIKEKTAFGYVMKFCEDFKKSPSKYEMDRMCKGLSGVKRTTGQHPGGIVVVPKGNDILEFTPIQYPADAKQKDVITTHFDFHALDDRLVKLDILGHVDPTALRMMQDLTGLDPREIPLYDPDTMGLYSGAEGLGIDLTALACGEVGSIGLPEFGTPFVRQMLMDTRPTMFEELVRIAGLSHGTDVWLNNAQALVRGGVAALNEVICTRDDIMNYLMLRGCEPSMAFKAMENVRKGKGLTPAMEEEMRRHDVPEWYIESCNKIKYMFPRAHAAAYVMMSFRVAYYKFHYPEAYYAVYFSVRADAFDVNRALGGAKRVLENIREIEAKGKDATTLEGDILTILEVVYEMNLRGITLLPVDIEKSDATKFLIEAGGIRTPFSAVAGIGVNAAQQIANALKGAQIHTVEDFQTVTNANSAAITALKEAGCFSELPETNQISLFQLM